MRRDPHLSTAIADTQNPYDYREIRGRAVDMTTGGQLSIQPGGRSAHPHRRGAAAGFRHGAWRWRTAGL